MTRCVVLSAARAPSAALRKLVERASQQHDEVIVAIDGAACAHGLALPERWATLRAALRDLPNSWVTPLADTPSLASSSDRMLALTSRLGTIDELWLEDASLLALARTLGLDAHGAHDLQDASAVVLPATLTADASRALVVMRAQPFHRGHLALIEHGLSLASEIIVVVAAAERAFSVRDPFTAGERLALVRAGLGALAERVWLVALPAPPWPAMALSQLALVAPPYQLVIAHNPILRALARDHGKTVPELPRPFCIEGQPLTATRVRARLANEGAGPWLEAWLPTATARLLASAPSLRERCAVIAAAGL